MMILLNLFVVIVLTTLIVLVLVWIGNKLDNSYGEFMPSFICRFLALIVVAFTFGIIAMTGINAIQDRMITRIQQEIQEDT